MTSANHPGSDHQLAVITIDAGHAREIMLMPAGAAAVTGDLAAGAAPAAASQAAASPDGAGSLYTLPALAAALTEVTSWLDHASRDVIAHIPPGF